MKIPFRTGDGHWTLLDMSWTVIWKYYVVRPVLWSV